VKKIVLIRFDRIQERNRHPDRRTDRQTLHDGIGRTFAQHRAAKTVSYTQASIQRMLLKYSGDYIYHYLRLLRYSTSASAATKQSPRIVDCVSWVRAAWRLQCRKCAGSTARCPLYPPASRRVVHAPLPALSTCWPPPRHSIVFLSRRRLPSLATKTQMVLDALRRSRAAVSYKGRCCRRRLD